MHRNLINVYSMYTYMCWRHLVTKFLVQDLDKWCQAVGCAGCIAYDGLIRAVLLLIHSYHICWDCSLPGCRDQHFLRTRGQMLTRSFGVHEHASSLDHQIDPELSAIDNPLGITTMALAWNHYNANPKDLT